MSARVVSILSHAHIIYLGNIRSLRIMGTTTIAHRRHAMRLCHSAALGSITDAAAGGGAPAATSRAGSDRLRCPECGKAFLHDGTLRLHRRSRHHINLPSPSEARGAALAADNTELERKLAEMRAAIKSMKSAASTSTAAQEEHSTERAFAAATAHQRVLRGLTAEELAGWQDRSKRAVGTSLSAWSAVGVVVKDSVELGTLDAFTSSTTTTTTTSSSSKKEEELDAAVAAASRPRVLQFLLETIGYREQRPGQLKMFRNRVRVRHFFDSTTQKKDEGVFTVRGGDVLRVQGHYATHKSFDMVSKLIVENVVVEADRLGLLRRGADVDSGVGGGEDVPVVRVEVRASSSSPSSRGKRPNGMECPPSISGDGAASGPRLTRKAVRVVKRKKRGNIS